LGKPDPKGSVLLSNSQTADVVEGQKSGLVGKLLVRKGDNPDRGKGPKISAKCQHLRVSWVVEIQGPENGRG
jgi:hypothetical protein